jgi:hypothetical protein
MAVRPKPGATKTLWPLPYCSPFNIVGATCIKRMAVEARAERLITTWLIQLRLSVAGGSASKRNELFIGGLRWV